MDESAKALPPPPLLEAHFTERPSQRSKGARARSPLPSALGQETDLPSCRNEARSGLYQDPGDLSETDPRRRPCRMAAPAAAAASPDRDRSLLLLREQLALLRHTQTGPSIDGVPARGASLIETHETEDKGGGGMCTDNDASYVGVLPAGSIELSDHHRIFLTAEVRTLLLESAAARTAGAGKDVELFVGGRDAAHECWLLCRPAATLAAVMSPLTLAGLACGSTGVTGFVLLLWLVGQVFVLLALPWFMQRRRQRESFAVIVTPTAFGTSELELVDQCGCPLSHPRRHTVVESKTARIFSAAAEPPPSCRTAEELPSMCFGRALKIYWRDPKTGGQATTTSWFKTIVRKASAQIESASDAPALAAAINIGVPSPQDYVSAARATLSRRNLASAASRRVEPAPQEQEPASVSGASK